MATNNPSAGTPAPVAEMSVAQGLLPLAVIVFLSFSTIGLPLPALPIQVNEVLGFSAVVVGWVIGLQSLTTVLTRQLAGKMADSAGPKKVVLVGLPLSACAGLAYLVSTMVSDPNQSLWIILFGRVLLGVAESLFLTGAMIWGIARLGVHRAGRVMTWQGIAMFSALAAGGPTGVWVMQAWGFVGIALLTIILPLIGVGFALSLQAVTVEPGVRQPFFKVVGMIWRHGMVLLLGTVPYATIIVFITLYYNSRDWAGAGFAYAGFGGGYIFVRLFLAHLPDRAGALKIAAVSMSVEVVGMAVLFFASSGTMAFVGAMLTGVGFSLVFPSVGAEAVRMVPPQDRGSAVSGFHAFLDIGLGLTGPFMGLIIAFGGFRPIFLVGGAAAVLAIALVLKLSSSSSSAQP